jgi:hypothetical protein
MGTSIYGSHDELVFELSIADRLRNGLAPRSVRVKLDDICTAHAADPTHLVSWEGQRALWIGRARRTTDRVLVLELVRTAGSYDRIVVCTGDPDAAVRGLHRGGIGVRRDGVPAAA